MLRVFLCSQVDRPPEIAWTQTGGTLVNVEVGGGPVFGEQSIHDDVCHGGELLVGMGMDLIKQSVTTRMYLLPWGVSGKGPMTSMVTRYRRTLTWKLCRGALL